MSNSVDLARNEMKTWRVQSPDSLGWHAVVEPNTSASKVSYIYRLNLAKGQEHTIQSGKLEMNAVLIQGKAKVSHPAFAESMNQFDSFYIPGNEEVLVTAEEDLIFYVGAGECEGVGKAFFRLFDLSIPLGEIHQIHGHGSGAREVMFTLNPEVPASRLLCGLTWGGDGGWTSWPPHQHERDLEEVYCYFDMPEPHFGFHVSYLETGKIEDGVFHKVNSGTFVQAPKGYHPTVSSPGTKNAYFWVLVAFTPESRRYDLAMPDPSYIP